MRIPLGLLAQQVGPYLPPETPPEDTLIYSTSDTIRVKIESLEPPDKYDVFGPDINGYERVDVGDGVKVVCADGEVIHDVAEPFRIVTIDISGDTEIVTFAFDVGGTAVYDVTRGTPGGTEYNTPVTASVAGGDEVAKKFNTSLLTGISGGSNIFLFAGSTTDAPSAHTDPTGYTRIAEIENPGAGGGGGEDNPAITEETTTQFEGTQSTGISKTLASSPTGKRVVIVLGANQLSADLDWAPTTTGTWTLDGQSYRSNSGGSASRVWSATDVTDTVITVSGTTTAEDTWMRLFVMENTDNAESAAGDTYAGYAGAAGSPIPLQAASAASTDNAIHIGIATALGTVTAFDVTDPNYDDDESSGSIGIFHYDTTNASTPVDIDVVLGTSRQCAAVLVTYPATVSGGSSSLSLTVWAKGHSSGTLADADLVTSAATSGLELACLAVNDVDLTAVSTPEEIQSDAVTALNFATQSAVITHGTHIVASMRNIAEAQTIGDSYVKERNESKLAVGTKHTSTTESGNPDPSWVTSDDACGVHFFVSATTTTADPPPPPTGSGEWEYMSPGGGGFRVEIAADPGTPGRLGTGDDNGGAYQTYGYADEWEYIAHNLQQVTATKIVFDPNDPNRVYVGTECGFHISNDGGFTYDVPSTGGMNKYPVSTCCINQWDDTVICAGPSWDFRLNVVTGHSTSVNPSTTGTKVIWYSVDDGVTWKESAYAGGTGTRQVSDIVWVNATTVLVAAADGIYRGTLSGSGASRTIGSWTKFNPPTGKGACRGLDITPDKKTLIAAWQNQSGWIKQGSTATLFAHDATNPNNYENLGKSAYNYWHPRIDPGAGGATTWDDVLTGPIGDFYFICPIADKTNVPLEEYRVQYSGDWPGASGTPTVSTKTVIAASSTVFDQNWDNVPPPRPYEAIYYPREWFTGTYKRTVAFVDGHWMRSCEVDNRVNTQRDLLGTFISTVGGVRQYRGSGAANITHTDVDGLGDYIMLSQADNWCTESHDENSSWGLDRPNKNSVPGATAAMAGGTACRVIPTSPPIAMVSNYQGYGSPDTSGGWLWTKKLTNGSFQDGWKQSGGAAAGGSADQGLPDDLVYGIDYDPNDPKHVLLASVGGIYETTDINAIHSGSASWNLIQAGTYWSIAFYPGSSTIVFASSSSGVDRLTKSGSSWSKTQVQTQGKQPLRSWQFGGNKYVVQGGSGQGVRLSINNGNFNTVMTISEWNALATWDWYDAGDPHLGNKGPITAVTGYDNVIFAAGSNNDLRKGHVIAKGVITGSNVSWSRFSGTPEARGHRGGTSTYCFATRTDSLRVATLTSGRYLLVAGRGHAGWRIKL